MNTQEDDSLLYRSGGGKGKLLWWVGIGLFVAWNILLFILAVVAIAKVNNQSTSSSSHYTYAPISRGFTVALNQQIAGGKAVSLQANGRLRVGGGTSVYLSKGPKPGIPLEATNVVGTTFNPPATGITFLANSEIAFVAFTVGGEVYGTLGVLSLDGTSLSTWSPPKVITGLTVSEALIPLNSVSTASAKESFVLAGAGKLVVGIVTGSNQNDLSFSFSAVQTYNGTENTVLARLSFNEFALAYGTVIQLNPTRYKMQATIGVVTYNAEGGFGSLSLSGGFEYAADRPYHTIQPLVDSSKPVTNEFIIAYPSSNAILINSTTAPDDTLIVVKGKWMNNALTFGPTTPLVGVRPNMLLTGVGMTTTTENSDPKCVLVFVNEKENNAITAVTVIKDPSTMAKIDGLAFGSTLKVGDNAGDDTFQVNKGKVVPFISAAAIDDLKVGLVYSNFADEGKLTTTVLEVNPYSLDVSLISAKFVISNANPDVTKNYWWVQAAPLRFTSQTGYAIWGYLETPAGTNNAVIQQTVVEVAPAPLGVTPMNAPIVSQGNSANVVLSGVYAFPDTPFSENLGRYFYTDTLGTLHVRNTSSASVDYVVAGGVLLSLNSRVGVAVSNNELLLINELS